MDGKQGQFNHFRKGVEKISKLFFFLATNQIFDYFPQITYKKPKGLMKSRTFFLVLLRTITFY